MTPVTCCSKVQVSQQPVNDSFNVQSFDPFSIENVDNEMIIHDESATV